MFVDDDATQAPEGSLQKRGSLIPFLNGMNAIRDQPETRRNVLLQCSKCLNEMQSANLGEILAQIKLFRHDRASLCTPEIDDPMQCRRWYRALDFPQELMKL